MVPGQHHQQEHPDGVQQPLLGFSATFISCSNAAWLQHSIRVLTLTPSKPLLPFLHSLDQFVFRGKHHSVT
jgi:hypothetical protein